MVKTQRKNTPTDDDPLSHGSCVLSKAIGAVHGVYKNAKGLRDKNSKILVVKIAAQLQAADIFDGFNRVLIDVQANHGTEPAVVMFPYASKPDVDSFEQEPIKLVMQAIFNLGGTIVVPSGNHAKDEGREDVDGYPALWEGPNFPLIVISAVDNAGARADLHSIVKV